MSYKIYPTLSALIIVLYLLNSCHGNKNDFSIVYKYTGVSVENAKNTGDLPLPTTDDSIPVSAYAIQVNLFTEVIAEGNAYPDYDHPPENSNSIKTIEVTSSADFGPGFPAGTVLNDNFIFFNGSYFTTSSVDNFSFSTSDEVYLENSLPNKFDLLLIGDPVLPSSHVFTVKLEFYDGTNFIDSTTLIKLY